MKKLSLLIIAFVIAFSCKKKSEIITDQNTNDTANTTNTLLLQTFIFPAEVQGCSCYFAKDKADFEKQQYIYVDDYGNNAYTKIGGNLIKFPMEEGDFDPDNFEKTLDNGEYKLTMKGKKLNSNDETMIFEGEITLENKNGEKTTSPIYGECGC